MGLMVVVVDGNGPRDDLISEERLSVFMVDSFIAGIHFLDLCQSVVSRVCSYSFEWGLKPIDEQFNFEIGGLWGQSFPEDRWTGLLGVLGSAV